MNQQLSSPISQLPLAKFQHVLILLFCCIFVCDIKFPIVMNLSLHELHEMFDLCGFFQYILHCALSHAYLNFLCLQTVHRKRHGILLHAKLNFLFFKTIITCSTRKGMKFHQCRQLERQFYFKTIYELRKELLYVLRWRIQN